MSIRPVEEFEAEFRLANGIAEDYGNEELSWSWTALRVKSSR
jgi:hypothetical protein